MVIDVSAFVDDEKIRKEVYRLSMIREYCLEICWKIPGYDRLPLLEKNKIYSEVKKRVEDALGITTNGKGETD